MSLNDWQPVPLVATGDLWTAAEHNTYIRNNQQVLHDGLAAGHGSGSNADMVDGRHATGFVRSDEIVASFTASDDGWYTIATGAGRRYGRFVIAENGRHGHNIAVFDASWAFSGGSSWPSTLREVMYTRYSVQAVRGVRILYDTNDAVYGTAKLQVFLKSGSYSPYNIYQLIPLAEADDGVWKKWDVQSPPVHEDAPNGYAVQRAIAVGNSSWRLARSGNGGGTIGWLTASDMQIYFPPNTYSGYNPTEVMDGSTSTKLADGQAVMLRAQHPIYIEGLKAWYYCYGSGYGNRTVTFYVSMDGSAWTQVASFSVTPDAIRELTASFTRTQVLYIKMTTSTTGAEETFREVSVNLSSSLTIAGVPLGCAVSLIDSGGNVMETATNDVWTAQTPVLFGTDPTQVDTIRITRPDGSTNWLQFPTWAIDGGALQNGDVLTLYSEA